MSAFQIQANVDPPTATATGIVKRIMTDSDRKAFGLEGYKLNEAVGRYKGRNPLDAWVRSPAVAGGTELYSRYGWDEVIVTLVPKSCTITPPNASQMTVVTSSLRNNSSVPGEFFANLSNETTNTTSTNWTSTHGIEVSQSVGYSIGVVEGETSFSYSYGWGQGGEESQASSVSLSTGATVTLQPGESVIVKLNADRGTARVTTIYEATVDGDVAINYNPPFEGHHFYRPDINDVLRASGKPTSITVISTVDIGYYAHSDVEMTDFVGKQLPSPAKAEIHKPLLRARKTAVQEFAD